MISIDSAGVHVLALTLSWYSVSVVIGIWLAVTVAVLLAKRAGQRGEDAWRALVWVVLCGLIGARVWFILFPPQSYVDNGLTAGWLLTHFFDLNQGAIALWAGGLGLIGGIAGSAIGLWLFARKNHLPPLIWLDIAAVVLPLAQAIGRLGEGAMQSTYGVVTTLPWGMLVSDPAQRVAPYTDLTRYPLDKTLFQPVYLYECLLALGIFLVLLVLFVRRFNPHPQPFPLMGKGAEHELQVPHPEGEGFRVRVDGDIALLYILAYGLGRFLIEFMRVNVSLVAGINISQVVAGLVALIAAGILFKRHTGEQQS